MALNLYAKFGMDGTGFNKGAEKIKSKAAGMKRSIGKSFDGLKGQIAGALAIGALSAASKETMDWGARVRDLAQQFGVTTDFVQKMDYAFKQTGGDSETAFKGVRKMMLAQGKLMNSFTSKMTKEMLSDAFNKIGLSMGDLKNKSPEDMFMKVASSLKNADMSSGELHDALNLIFGKGGSQMLVTFGNDLGAMSDRFGEIGGVVENDVVMQLGAASDKLEEFKSMSKPVLASVALGFLKIGTSAAGSMNKAIEGIENLATKFFAWKDDSKDMADFMAEEPDQEAKEAKEAKVRKEEATKEFAERYMTEEVVTEVSDEELSEHEEKLAAVAASRKAAATKLAKLQEAESKRAFDKLPAAQKALLLERQIVEEKRKQLELAKSLNATRESDKGRAELETAKGQRSQVTAQFGNVDEVFDAVAKLKELESRQAKLTETEGQVKGDKGFEKLSLADAEEEFRGTQQAVSDFVVAHPGVDYAQFEQDLKRIEELEAERDQLRQEGDMEAVVSTTKDISEIRKGAGGKLNKDEQREFARRLQMVKDAEAQYKAKAKSETGLKGFQEAGQDVEAAQLENAKKIEKTQTRINALREQYGADAVAAAVKAQQGVSAAELGLETQAAELRAQLAQAKADMKRIQEGETGIAATVRGSAGTLDESKLGVQQLQSAFESQKGGKGIVQEGENFGFYDAEGAFQHISQSADAADAFWSALPEKMAAAQMKMDANQKTHNANVIKQEDALAEARKRATKASNALTVMEGGGEETAVASAESRAREEQLKAQQAKLQEQAKKEAPKALPMAGENKFGSLARIGGALGGRNPVLDTAKQHLKTSQAIERSAKATADAVGMIAGTK